MISNKNKTLHIKTYSFLMQNYKNEIFFAIFLSFCNFMSSKLQKNKKYYIILRLQTRKCLMSKFDYNFSLNLSLN